LVTCSEIARLGLTSRLGCFAGLPSVKMAGEQRPSQIQIKNPSRPLCSSSTAQQIIDRGVNK
jgi:hypothetical protein